MSYCPACGTEVSSEASYCANCGEELAAPEGNPGTETVEEDSHPNDEPATSPGHDLQNPHLWKGVLTPQETVQREFTVSKMYRVRGAIIWSVVWGSLTVGLLIPAVLIYYFWYIPNSAAYLLTDKRLLRRDGLFSQTTKSIPLDRVTDTVVHEPFWENLLYGSGSLEINTAGSAGKELVLERIDEPQKVKRRIDRLVFS